MTASAKRPYPRSARWVLRSIRVRWRCGALDRALAAGIDPVSDPVLALRAWQVTNVAARRSTAESIESLVAAAAKPFEPASLARLQRDAIRRSRAQLLDLAERLRSASVARPQGVARAWLLLTDGSGPIYTRAAEGALERAAREAAIAI